MNTADPAAPSSPCTGVCRLDPAGRRCEGCDRTLDEIAAWSTLSEDERRAVLAALPARRAERGAVSDASGGRRPPGAPAA